MCCRDAAADGQAAVAEIGAVPGSGAPHGSPAHRTAPRRPDTAARSPHQLYTR